MMKPLMVALVLAAVAQLGCEPKFKEGSVRVTATADLGQVAQPPPAASTGR